MESAPITDTQASRLALDFFDHCRASVVRPVKKAIISIFGIPGAGKSTLARAMLPHLPGFVHAQANSARYLLKKAQLPWGENVQVVLRTVTRGFLDQGYGVLLDGGASEEAERAEILKIGEAFKVPVRFILVNTHLDFAMEKILMKYQSHWSSSFEELLFSSGQALAQNAAKRYREIINTNWQTVSDLTIVDNNWAMEEFVHRARLIGTQILSSL